MRARATARIGFAVFFAVAGVLHFALDTTFVRIVPPWVPYPLTVIWITGAMELALAAALLSRWHEPAGWALAAYLVAVLPANIHMALEPSLSFGLSPAVLWGRVALQLPLILAVLWATRAARRPYSPGSM